jgi:transposase
MESFLSEGQREEYRRRHKKCRDKREADRIKCILMLDKGYDYETIAQVLMMDDYTLRRWYADYIEKGMNDLLQYDYKGGEAKLSALQIGQLTTHLEECLYLSAKEICHYLRQEYGVEYTAKGMTSMLHRLGFTYKKPKQVPGKADAKAQEEFIKKYEELKAHRQPEDRFYFVDGVHPLHNSQPAFGWIKKGKEKPLLANTGRMRINFNGAYNAEEHRAIIREDETINAQSTVALFDQVLQQQPCGKVYFILDNARYNHAKDVREFVERNPRLQLLYLPPYSPNLNLIERLWKFFKKKITYNKYYEQFAVFRSKSIEFFENLPLYKTELESLMTENFHVIKLSQT